MLKISDKLAKCTQMYWYSCRKRKSLTFLFYRILTWDRARCAQLAETKRMVSNFPENEELFCVENFGQVPKLYRKMYRKSYRSIKRLTFLFYGILTWDRERCAQLAETKRTTPNFPENAELLCDEIFGQFGVLYTKMYSKCTSTRKTNFFV